MFTEIYFSTTGNVEQHKSMRASHMKQPNLSSAQLSFAAHLGSYDVGFGAQAEVP